MLKPLLLIPAALVTLGLTFCHSSPSKPTTAQAVSAAAPAMQSGLNADAASAAGQAQAKTLHIFVTAQEATHAIQNAPGAQEALSAPMLAGWGAGIDGVRAASTHGQPSQGPAQGGYAGPDHADQAVPPAG